MKLFLSRKAITKVQAIIAIVVIVAVIAAGVFVYYRPAPAKPPEKVTLRYMNYLVYEVTAAASPSFSYVKEKFEELHPGVTLEYIPVHWETTPSELSVMVAAGDPPDVALVTSEMQIISSLGALGALLPLDKYLSDELRMDIDPAVLAEGMYGGVLYGINQDPCPNMLICRKPLFEQAGLMDLYNVWQTRAPTWDEFERAIVEISALGPGIYGYATSTLLDFLSMDYYMTVLWGFGGDLLDDEGNVVINNTAGVEAAKWMKWGHYENNYMPKGEWIRDLRILMAENKLGMYIDGPWMKGIFSEYGLSPNVPEDYVAVPIPGKVTGESWTPCDSIINVIPAGSKHPDLAWELIEFMLTDETFAKKFVEETGFFPSLTSMQEKFGLAADPWIKPFLKWGLPHVKMPDWGPQYKSAAGVVMAAIQRVILDGADPKTALDDAAESLYWVYALK